MKNKESSRHLLAREEAHEDRQRLAKITNRTMQAGANGLPQGECRRTAEPTGGARRPVLQPTLASIRDTQLMLGGISRTQIYKLMTLGKLRSVSIGRRRLIIIASINQLVDENLCKTD